MSNELLSTTINKVDLPAGWIWSTLGEQSEKPQYGWTTKANADKGQLKLLRTTDITSGSVDWSSVPCCTDEPDDVEKYMVKSGDVLISRAGSVGVSFLINNPERAVFASYLIRFRPKKSIDTKYFYYYLKSPGYWDAIGASKSGIAVPNVNASKLSQVSIPVAPLDQQKVIVAEIEKQFSRLDEAVANLKRVKANLKRYKAAVLKAAVEGRLVETEAELARHEDRTYETGEQLLKRIIEARRSQWIGKGKYKEPAVPDTSYLPELPEGWVWASFDSLIADGPQNGLYLPKSLYGSGHPILRIDDYQQDWIRPVTELQLVNAKPGDVKTYSLRNGDLVINRVNSPSHLGKVAVWITRSAMPMFESNMMRIRLSPGVDPFYISMYLRSADGRARLTKQAKWAVNQASINQQDVCGTQVPLPPVAEQLRIVAEIDRRLSLVGEVEAQADANLLRAERLRQSILKIAFAGSLLS